jgi:hypothetical protein
VYAKPSELTGIGSIAALPLAAAILALSVTRA